MHKSVERYTYKDHTCKHILIYITIAVITTAIGFLLDRNAIRLVQGMMLPAMDYTFFTITTLS